MRPKPKLVRRAAAVFIFLTVVGGWPLSYYLPDIDPVLAQKVIMWWSALALTFTGVNWWTTAEVEVKQDES